MDHTATTTSPPKQKPTQQPHPCGRCGHAFCKKSDLVDHLLRVRPCDPLASDATPLELLWRVHPEKAKLYAETDGACYRCSVCGTFAARSHRAFERHRLRCLPERTASRVEEIEIIVRRHDDELRELRELREPVRELLREPVRDGEETAETAETAVIIGGDDGADEDEEEEISSRLAPESPITIARKPDLLPFGSESTGHLDPSFILSCFVRRDVAALVRAIHMDPLHPENHNVRQADDGGLPLLEMYCVPEDGDGDEGSGEQVRARWVAREDGLDELILKMYRSLSRYFRRRDRAETLLSAMSHDYSAYEDLMGWLEDLYCDERGAREAVRRTLALAMAECT